MMLSGSRAAPAGHLYRWEFERHGEALAVEVDGTLTLDEPTLMRDAAEAGLGLAYLAEFHVAEALAAGRPKLSWTSTQDGRL